MEFGVIETWTSCPLLILMMVNYRIVFSLELQNLISSRKLTKQDSEPSSFYSTNGFITGTQREKNEQPPYETFYSELRSCCPLEAKNDNSFDRL